MLVAQQIAFRSNLNGPLEGFTLVPNRVFPVGDFTITKKSDGCGQ